MREGTIATQKGRSTGSNRQERATGTANRHQPRIAVLVDGGSAAASEIVASALRVHAGALVVGQRTYGHGSVQTIMPLQNGAAIKLTTGRWYDAADVLLEGNGLRPDVELPTPPDKLLAGVEDPWIDRAVELLRSQRH
ncbi:S41 family peptidase [Solimonas soli]|uniref:S41 family peptidase n=1 Tax=Solimonas soli TaxID=413479 RepID=UPI00146FA4C2|nr:S41 family peptidase [Solimonas soli]